MARQQHTSVRSRRMAAELRRLRESSGMSCRDAAERLGMPVSRLRRLEAGASGFRLVDVEALLGLYDVPVDRRAELLAVARQCLRHTWWAQLTSQPRRWRSLSYLEAASSQLRDFQSYLLPCLLRTADYGRLVLRDGLTRRSAAEVDQLIDLQLARQSVLARPDGPALHAVVDEHAVGRLGRADAVSRGQVRQLLVTSERPNVTFQVIPNSVGVHAGMRGSFTIMECQDDMNVVYTEQFGSATYYQTEADIIEYRDTMASLLSVALSPVATRDFLHGLTSRR